MNLSDKMSYLKGLVDGMELDLTTKEGKVLGQLLDVLQETVLYVTDLQDQVDELTELCESLDEDLGDVEDAVFGDEEDDEDEADEFEDDDDDYVRIVRIRLYCQILFWMKARCIVRAATNCWNLITAI